MKMMDYSGFTNGSQSTDFDAYKEKKCLIPEIAF